MIDKCDHLRDLMKVQSNVVKKHIDEHKYLRHMKNKNEAIVSFIEDYGWLIREMYCTNVCENRVSCSIAMKLEKTGDLLKNHLKEGC